MVQENSSSPSANPAFNPQTVGREFVRQYYTVLNQGPHILHRFYNDDSSFIHGGPSKPGEVSNPVFGQTDINDKIKALNFKDCHAKITQVDSMETIGHGVVIQVIGELSNNGQPMRRFLQTFVLALQSPTKYYVRNDIFRYQDEIFLDEDECSEAERTDAEQDRQELVPQPTNTQPMASKESSITSTAATDFYESVNGNAHETTQGDKVEAEVSSDPVTDVKDIDYPPDIIGKNDEYLKPSIQNQQSELKTYANMVSKTPVVFGPPFASQAVLTNNIKNLDLNNTSAPITRPTEASPTPNVTLPTSHFNNQVPAPINKPPQTGNFMGQRPTGGDYRGRPRNQHNNNARRNDSREITPGRNTYTDGESTENIDFPIKKQYPDEQQVFVGNLPQAIDDEQLRTFFSKYGKILDVRINRQNQKAQAGKTPNYGFVTFENADIVQSILKQKPIYFDNHRFNVEEKRSQQARNLNMGNNNPGARNSSGGSLGGRLNNSTGNISGGNRLQGGGFNARRINLQQQGSSGSGQRGQNTGGNNSGIGSGNIGPVHRNSYTNNMRR